MDRRFIRNPCQTVLSGRRTNIFKYGGTSYMHPISGSNQYNFRHPVGYGYQHSKDAFLQDRLYNYSIQQLMYNGPPPRPTQVCSYFVPWRTAARPPAPYQHTQHPRPAMFTHYPRMNMQPHMPTPNMYPGRFPMLVPPVNIGQRMNASWNPVQNIRPDVARNVLYRSTLKDFYEGFAKSELATDSVSEDVGHQLADGSCSASVATKLEPMAMHSSTEAISDLDDIVLDPLTEDNCSEVANSELVPIADLDDIVLDPLHDEVTDSNQRSVNSGPNLDDVVLDLLNGDDCQELQKLDFAQKYL